MWVINVGGRHRRANRTDPGRSRRGLGQSDADQVFLAPGAAAACTFVRPMTEYPHNTTATVADTPRLRGVFHQWSVAVSIVIGAIFVLTRTGTRETLAAGIYVLAVVVMFGVSTLFHRIDWSEERVGRMLQLDKSGIYLMISGTFTPIAAVGLQGTFAIVMLVIFWSLSLLLIALLWLPWKPPYGLITGTYIGTASLGLLTLPAMWTEISPNFTVLILLGGVLFIGGSFMLALRRPDPWPDVFGYHEVWHLIVIVATAVHFVAIATYVY